MIKKGLLCSTAIIGLICANSTHASPYENPEVRASLSREGAATIMLDRCKLKLRECLVEASHGQIACLGNIATSPICRNHPAAAALQRRVTLELAAEKNLDIRRCVTGLDAGISAWLMSPTPGSIDNEKGAWPSSEDFASESEFEPAITECESLQPGNPAK